MEFVGACFSQPTTISFSTRAKRVKKNREENLLEFPVRGGELSVTTPTADRKNQLQDAFVGEDNTEKVESLDSSHHSNEPDEHESETISDLSTQDNTTSKTINDNQVQRILDAVAKQSATQEIQVELAKVTALYEELKKDKANLENRIDSLQKELRDIQSQSFDGREKLMAEKNRIVIEAENIRRELHEKIEELDKVKSKSKAANNKVLEEKHDLFQEKARIDVELKKVSDELQETQTNLSKLAGEYELANKHHNAEREQLHREKEKLLEDIDELQDRIDKAEMRLLESEKEARHAKVESDNHMTTISKLNDRIRELEIEVVENERLSKQCEEELRREMKLEQEKLKQKWDEDVHTRQAQYEELEHALSEAQQKLEQAKCEQTRLMETIDSLEKKLLTEQGNQAQIRHDSCAQTEKLALANKSLVELQSKNQEKQVLIDKLERELAQMQVENRDLRGDLQGQKPREEALYKKLQVSNQVQRELLAKVMQLTGNIRVFVRVRPVLNGETPSTLIHFPGHTGKPNLKGGGNTTADDLTKKLIEVVEPEKDRGGLTQRRKKLKFGFDNVFGPEATQNEVWCATEPLIQCAIDGFNVTIFAYGQTSAGKTYTLLGDGVSSHGLIGKSIEKIFGSKHDTEMISENRSSVKLSVEVLEIYNEKVYDLLVEDPKKGKEQHLKVISQEVVGNTVHPVENEKDIFDRLNKAQKRRCVKETKSNLSSSRSHLVFTLNISVQLENGEMRNGKLNICDLAGSERLSKSGANEKGVSFCCFFLPNCTGFKQSVNTCSCLQGALLKETQNINKSLLNLSNVIRELQAGNSVVPFRDSILTSLLQKSLIGDSKTLAIVCCSPLDAHHNETVCSLRFAEKANKVDLNKSVQNAK